jgi:cyclohexa-1,5-dienecarbonyl-CoA hydratase
MEEQANYVLYSCKDGLAKITFNRPQWNILNIEMLSEINQRIADLQFATDVKLLMFSTAGETFSAGISIEEHTDDKTYQMIDEFHKMIRNLYLLNIPTMAVVKGAALGGACQLVSLCDLAFAAESAKFGQPEIKVGIFPTVGAVLFPYLMGMKKTMELLLTGQIISAHQAVEINLINKVVPDNALESETEKFIATILSNSAVVIQNIKQAVRSARLIEFTEALRIAEDIYLTQLLPTEDAQEGIKAFLEKRKPQWQNK